jgi:NAD(P)-dependent dehydrogenase (short-subunit alcohol dehydrogenase family)
VKLEGTSALIVGGAGGLGEATTRRLVGAGAAVVIADLADDRAKVLADELGEKVRYVRTDVTQTDDVLAAIAAAQELAPLRVSVAAHGGDAIGGRIVNKAGEPLSLEGFRRTLEVYLTGTYNVMRLVAAELVKSEPVGESGRVPYAAAKGGVVGMTIVAARDLAVSGVRVNTIAPGTFYTPAYGMPEEQATEMFGKGIPFPKRMGRASEYAALVQSIIENDYLNGETIRLDAALRFAPK